MQPDERRVRTRIEMLKTTLFSHDPLRSHHLADLVALFFS